MTVARTVVPLSLVALPAALMAVELPVGINADSTWLMAALLLAAGTLISEDLTCLGAGFLAAQGAVPLSAGIVGCVLGIWLGDIALWLIGAAARQGLPGASSSRPSGLRGWIHRQRTRPAVQGAAKSLQQRGASLIWLSRFMPGTRLPLYLAAGLAGMPLSRFALASGLAVMVWTPTIIVCSYIFGEAVLPYLVAADGAAWLLPLLLALALMATVHLVHSLTTAEGRFRWRIRLGRAVRYEFWPMWLFYLPLVPWVSALTLRYGWRSLTASNPGIRYSGVVGESKIHILRPLRHAISSVAIPPGDPWLRLRVARRLIQRRGWQWPLVVKPNANQRGVGVRRVHDVRQLEAYFETCPDAVLIQPVDPGPHEVGIFYQRFPGEARGRIVGITRKEFPVLHGDGLHTLRQLIRSHPRFRFQYRIFESRHAERLEDVPAAGEQVVLAHAGNHCQGTCFRDGAADITPGLTQAMDAIANSLPGFHIGRFDVRYSRPEDLHVGRNLRIVELNGATGESTNIYDPSWSLWRAYGALFAQWELVFRTGARARRAGAPSLSAIRTLGAALHYYRYRADPGAIAD